MSMVTANTLLGSTYGKNWFARDRGGVAGGLNRALVHGGGPTSDSTWSGGTGNCPYTEGDHIYISRPFFYDDVTYRIRGYPAGLYQACHKVLESPFVQLESRTVDGTPYLYMVFYTNGGNKGQVLLSLDDWRV